jgi:type VII secretion protein EccB
MANKKELIEAQGFSRRRLLSAFVGGAPGGKELEPAQPLRAVVAGVALTAMLVVGGVFYGLIRPGLPAGWENNRLILVSDTGARYVSIKKVLYPVINTASARLMIDPSEFRVITTDQASLEGIEIGATMGILGAPDALPAATQLINDGWSACQRDAITSLAISTQFQAIATDSATVVRVKDVLYVISGELRYAVDREEEDSILRAVQLNGVTPEDVDGSWLNLFTEGADLAPLIVRNAGERIGGTDLEIGSVVHPEGSADDKRYLITEDAEIADLSPLAYQLYMLGTGTTLGEAIEVPASAYADLENAVAPAGGADWPLKALTALETEGRTCALLTHVDGAPHTVLGTLRDDSQIDESTAGVTMERGHGSLVLTGKGSSSLVYLIDESGTSYAVPAATEDVLARLGYEPSDLAQVGPGWLQFMISGPALDKAAAQRTPRVSDAP